MEFALRRATLTLLLTACKASTPDPDADSDVVIGDLLPLQDTDEISDGNDSADWADPTFDEADLPATPTATTDIQPLFSVQCAPCHNPGGQGGLTLTDMWASTVSQPAVGAPLNRIEPGDPGRSYLYLKLQGTQVVRGGMGVRMPKGKPPLAQRDRALIRRWIEQGAVR